jgi:predicted O-methyltransferase YrrM
MNTSYVFNKNFKKDKIIEFFRQNTNAESGGYKIYDGIGNHCLQNPEELAWLILNLKKIEKKIKFKNFLEFGYASGFTNTILNKFFNFEKIVAVDIISQEGQCKESFFANLRFKNMILLCGNSTTDFVKEQISVNSKYDLVFIDGGHEYNVVKSDYLLSLKNVKERSVIVFHDVDSNLCDGPKQLWLEIKKKNPNKTFEYSCKKYKAIYGIGILIND